MKKKVILAVISVLFVFFLLPNKIKATTKISEGTEGDYNYKIYEDNGEKYAVLTKYNGTATSVTIPSKIAGYSVTNMGEDAFFECSSLTSITIPEGVTSIGIGAFYGCSSLEKINVDDNNTKYTSINGILYNKDKNELIQCPSKIKLTSITIPESVVSIESSAFFECSSLTNITIPNSVTSIGYAAFERCSSLTSITIPKGVTNIEGYTFYKCNSLKRITIPDSVTSIGYYAFRECISLKRITIPDSVTSIGGYAFGSCYNLKNITIPSSVTSIGIYAFYGCSSLEKINVDDNNTKYTSINGILYNKDKNKLIQCPSKIKLTSITIPETVTSIGEDAFFECSSLTSITIPEGVTSIEDYTFYGCSNLTNITIPKGVTSIGYAAFDGCSSLTSITIPEGVTSIGGSAFSFCSSLVSITIPNGVTKIGSFDECSSLTSITIPNSVTNIENITFYNCKSLTSITIPEGVTSIGEYTFYGCDNLKKCILVGDAPEIHEIAFSSKTKIYYRKGTTGYTSANGWPTNQLVQYDEKVDKSSLKFNDKTSNTINLDSSLMNVIEEFSVKSENESIATVKQSGQSSIVITPVANGNTNIIVTLKYSDYITRKVKVGVTVDFKATSISLNKTTLVFSDDNTQTITATVLPDYANNKNVTWSINNESVAKVDENGKVTPIGNGTCTITATAKDGTGIKATCYVAVTAKTKKIELEDLTITKDEDVIINKKVTPNIAKNNNFTWSSSNVNIATVSSTGKVTPLKNGTCNITCKAEDGSNVSSTCKVKVNIPPMVPRIITSKLNDKNGQDYVEGTWTNQNIYIEFISKITGEKVDHYEWSHKNLDWTKQYISYSSEIGILTLNVNRNEKIKIRAVDKSGNISDELEYDVKIDKMLPTLTVSKNGGDYIITPGNNTVEVKETLTAKDEGGSGLDILKYQFSKSETIPDNTDKNWKTFTNGKELAENLEGGIYYLYTYVTDKAGNRATNVQKSNAYNIKNQVAYDANGGTGEMTIDTVLYGEKYITKENEFRKEGYTFVGWNEKADGTGVSWTNWIGKPWKWGYTKSITLYAQWSSMVLNKTEMTLDMSGNKTEKIIPSGNYGTISYASSDESIAKVDESGNVTAVGNGTCEIVVTGSKGNVKAICKVNVKTSITEITLAKTALIYTDGNPQEVLVKTILPVTASNKNVKYTSSNESIAKVDEKGKVTPIGNGECKIVVTAEDGSGVKAECIVKVDLPYKKGDWNNDGKVDVTDAYLLLTAISKNSKELEEKKTVVDMNGDNKVDVTDAYLLLQEISKK